MTSWSISPPSVTTRIPFAVCSSTDSRSGLPVPWVLVTVSSFALKVCPVHRVEIVPQRLGRMQLNGCVEEHVVIT